MKRTRVRWLAALTVLGTGIGMGAGELDAAANGRQPATVGHRSSGGGGGSAGRQPATSGHRSSGGGSTARQPATTSHRSSGGREPATVSRRSSSGSGASAGGGVNGYSGNRSGG